MARNGPLDSVLAQIAADQQQAAADAQRQRIAEHNAAANAHYDALQFVLAVQHAHEMNEIGRRFSPNG